MTLQEAHKRLDDARRLLRVASLSRGVTRIDALLATVDETLNVLLHVMESYDFRKSLSHEENPFDVELGGPR